MADSSSIPPDIVRITAPILLGPMFNWALYGVLCVQTYVYSYNFPDDKKAIKFLTYSVFLIETVQTALTGGDIYYWFIAGFGDMDRLQNSRFSAIDSPTIDAIISLIVQGFFSYRIWTLNKRMWWICVVISILSVVQAVGASWGGVKSATIGRYAVIKPALYLWLITSAVVDILIAISMTLLLRRMRHSEGRAANYILPRVVRLTIETNSLTASVAIVSFILYVGFPNDIYYTCPTGIIGKLYSNTLMVTLNNRIYFRDHPSPENLGDSAHIPQIASGRRGEPHEIKFTTQPRCSQSTTSNDTSMRPHVLLPPTDTEKGISDFITTRPVTP